MIVFDEVWGDAIADKAGTHFNPKCDVVVARVRDDEILGGVIFQNYTRESIGMHVASWEKTWLNRDILQAVFGYAFLQLGVKRIITQTPDDNLVSQKFQEHIGFRLVSIIPGVYERGVGCRVYIMDREDCRFLRLRTVTQLSNAA